MARRTPYPASVTKKIYWFDGGFYTVTAEKTNRRQGGSPLYEVTFSVLDLDTDADYEMNCATCLFDDIEEEFSNLVVPFFECLMLNSAEDWNDTQEFSDLSFEEYQEWIAGVLVEYGSPYSKERPAQPAPEQPATVTSTMGYKEAYQYNAQELKEMGVLAVVPDVDLSDMLLEFGLA